MSLMNRINKKVFGPGGILGRNPEVGEVVQMAANPDIRGIVTHIELGPNGKYLFTVKWESDILPEEPITADKLVPCGDAE